MSNLIAAVLLSFVVERVLAVFFDLTGSGEALKVGGSSTKGLIAVAIAAPICIFGDIDIVQEVIVIAKGAAAPQLPPWIGEIMTGIFVAGGSQGAVKLFQDVLGFSKANRDVINKSREAAAIAAKDKAERDQAQVQLERQRIENSLAAAQKQRLIDVYSEDTDKEVAEIVRQQKLRRAREAEFAAIDPAFLSRPSDPYLRDVVDDWDDFVLRRARLLAEEARQKAARGI